MDIGIGKAVSVLSKGGCTSSGCVDIPALGFSHEVRK